MPRPGRDQWTHPRVQIPQPRHLEVIQKLFRIAVEGQFAPGSIGTRPRCHNRRRWSPEPGDLLHQFLDRGRPTDIGEKSIVVSNCCLPTICPRVGNGDKILVRPLGIAAAGPRSAPVRVQVDGHALLSYSTGQRIPARRHASDIGHVTAATAAKLRFAGFVGNGDLGTGQRRGLGSNLGFGPVPFAPLPEQAAIKGSTPIRPAATSNAPRFSLAFLFLRSVRLTSSL